MKTKKVLTFFFLFVFPSLSLQAYWVWSPETGKFVNPESGAQDSAEEQYDTAMKLFRDKNLDAAEEKIKEILKRHPNSKTAPEAQYRLGTIYEEKNDFLKAFKAYKVLVETYPQSERFNEVIEREFRIANLFLSGKKAKLAGLEILPSLPRAAEVFQHIVKYAPYSDYGDKAQFHLGLTYKKWGHFGDAVEAFQAVIDQYPQSELVPQARYQIAESSYARSASEYRDQRALDDASKQVDRFIERYPDSSTNEKAARLKQAIDEKNAEKNYRIALYYEKDSYIQSALIYYEDAAKRYPNTKWGEKAAQKIKTLKAPAEYLNNQEKELTQELQTLEQQLKAIPEKDDLERGTLKRKIELLEKRQKALDKNKKESIDRREEDLKRRERELKEKFKNLEEKKKLAKGNPSEDFKRALERWRASLVEENDALMAERKQLQGWREEMGLPEKKGFDFLPFIGEGPSEMDKVRQIEAKKLYKLSEEKNALLEEKEVLYKQHSEVSALLKQAGAPAARASNNQAPLSDAQLKSLQLEIEAAQSELKEKKEIYEKRYGKTNWAAWVTKPGQVLSSSGGAVAKSLDKSIDRINPFSGEEKNENQQTLLEKRMHLREKISAQESIVQTLSEAFNEELAMQERKRLLASLNKEEKPDPKELRKTIKGLEKEIRGGYEEIQDRDQKKAQLVEQLDALLKNKEAQDPAFVKTGRAIAAPFVGTGRFFKSFLFGLPHKDIEVSKSADKVSAESPNAQQMKNLKEEIELESIMIEAKSREIVNQQKELEIVKAQASLAGGYQFRPVLIRVPYLFINEAIDNARKAIPKKDRQELIINRLNEESEKLESYKKQLQTLESRIDTSQTTETSEPVKAQKTTESKPLSEQDRMKQEIQELSAKLEQAQKDYSEKYSDFQQSKKASAKQTKEIAKLQNKASKESSERKQKLEEELQGIDREITKLIQKEAELEAEETTILEKRIQHIDRAVQKVESRVISQDLLTERERMESRLTDLESRKDYLSKELRRFDFAETPATRS
jgi:outer membrane assembly lipoprotein YfiO